MAEEALVKLEQQLKCVICLDTYTDPKLLQCFHVYCRECLVKLVIQDELDELSLTCPICRQDTPVPASGVQGLQSAFQVNHLLEIMDEHKKNKDDTAISDREEVDVNLTFLSSSKTVIRCSKHDRELELLCETCEEFICLKCALKGNKHHSHDYDELEKAYEKYKEEVTPSLEPMEGKLKKAKETLDDLKIFCKEISDQQGVVEAKIRDSIEQLHEVLNIKETELIGRLHHLTQRKLKGLAEQSKQMKAVQAKLESCVNFVKESLTTESQGDVLKIRKAIVKQVKELATPFQSGLLKPITEADVGFFPSPDVSSSFFNFGEVYSLSEPYALKCFAVGKNLELAEIGKQSTAILKTFNIKGEPCEETTGSLRCELVSEISGVLLRASVTRRELGKYDVSYQPTIKGKHQLHISVMGQHIRGSPFNLLVALPVQKLTSSFLTISGMSGPCGVVINQRGEVVVTENSGHCVSVFRPNGEKIRSFGTQGFDRGQFKNPRGVTMDNDGNIIVLDNHRIQKFSADFKFIKTIGTRGSGPMQFECPKDIAFNPYNNMLYVVDKNSCIQVLKTNLAFFSMFSQRGVCNGQLNEPCGIACDSNGKIYIVDFGNNRVQVFSAEGKFLRILVGGDLGKGGFCKPIGVTVDSADTVYVSLYGSECDSCISVFNSEGHYITSFGKGRAGEPGAFKLPIGMAVDISGVVYVCDGLNHCVKLF